MNEKKKTVHSDSRDVPNRLREWCRDYSGEMMVREAYPREGINCGLLYDAADELQSLKRINNELRYQLSKARAGCNGE